MGQHKNVEPMTAAQRLAYSAKIREIAIDETKPTKAEILHWIADNYERKTTDE